jgi:hypothetical protein
VNTLSGVVGAQSGTKKVASKPAAHSLHTCGLAAGDSEMVNGSVLAVSPGKLHETTNEYQKSKEKEKSHDYTKPRLARCWIDWLVRHYRSH